MSWSVTLAMAETTTTGRRPAWWRPSTIERVRRMAAASCTEVPPNFMTTIFCRGVDKRAYLGGESLVSFGGSTAQR
jgi:hypothetical protein